jgi:predicted DNA-binding protein
MDPTPTTPIRMPLAMRKAYDNVCKRLDTTRTEDLLAHVRRQINRHGSEEDLGLLAEAEAELKERRARKGGRPRRKPSAD